MNVLIRTDSSSKIGIGHVMRDLVLAEQFEKDKVFFATRNLEGNINEKIINSGFELLNVKSNVAGELISLIKNLKIDLLVIDHYEIDYNYETYIKDNLGIKIICLDDTYEKHNCDILLNHNVSADESKYKDLVPEYCELRCGFDFTLLRKEFIDAKKNKIIIKKNSKLKTVFIVMGGADHSNINIRILEVLSGFSAIKAIVVTTKANNNLAELQDYCLDNNWIDLHVNSNRIAYLIRISDFAIVTPSVIVNEILFMELPFIAIKTAVNQNDMYEYLVKNNYPVLEEFNPSILKVKLLLDYIGIQEK